MKFHMSSLDCVTDVAHCPDSSFSLTLEGSQTDTGRDGASLLHWLMCSPHPCPTLVQIMGELLCGRAEDMPDVIKRESSRLPTGLSVGMVQVS